MDKIKEAVGIAKTRLLRKKHLKDCLCAECFSDKTLIFLAQDYLAISRLQEQPREEIPPYLPIPCFLKKCPHCGGSLEGKFIGVKSHSSQSKLEEPRNNTERMK